jgi:hypothetical protein
VNIETLPGFWKLREFGEYRSGSGQVTGGNNLSAESLSALPSKYQVRLEMVEGVAQKRPCTQFSEGTRHKDAL